MKYLLKVIFFSILSFTSSFCQQKVNFEKDTAAINLTHQIHKYDEIIKTGNFDNVILNHNELPDDKSLGKGYLYLNQGLKHYLESGNFINAYNSFKKSLSLAEDLGDDDLASLSIQYILEMYSRTVVSSNDISYQYLISELLNKPNINSNIEKANYYNFKITLKYFYEDLIKVDSIYKKTNNFFKNQPISSFKAQNYINNGSYHTLITKNLDSSKYYIELANEYFKSKYDYFDLAHKAQINLTLGVINFKQEHPDSAISFLNRAYNSKEDAIFKNINSYVFFWKSEVYKSIGDTLKALRYNNKFLTQELLINQSDNLQLISEYETKYETAKKEQEVIAEKQKSKQNLYVAIGLGGSLILGGVIAFLLFKSTKRKQKLAEQEKEIESQKLATVLKDQELTAIDAMIEGQEKERQRIANDLHDDLGGLMATVKLHFNALKDKKSPELFDKTNNLIDEAYQKVRSVAHAKNSGVIAKHGLLKSVKELADKISIANKLNIEVMDYGLDTRLENSLELTIFRIIQELISNAVKHANASDISVHITNHEDSLNLMVEDNGVGFNPNQITKTKKGMGISSIDKRVEHLDGKLTIESEKNKGTTVIIDIPL
ncbi:MAG: sensor histidine kinase [Winogradskyella sp.]|uniref:sensor histidine kinase n=1 Tax=Winogradskyella sp. TaxID=1883156 RepID=UPI000F3C398E|nr:sensor histidine kinase [Winogradskyella sp.]RNC86755.1 MAG: sensor histidine kinase [Winogradskyella sp.]